MKLDDGKIKDYHEKGFLIFENMLNKDEIISLKDRILQFENHKDQSNVICEDDEIRSVFAPHKIFEEFDRLYRHKELINISSKLIDEEIYLYQYKINLKKPFVGKWWEWHQDFPYWKLDDGIENPDMVSVMIYLDDVDVCQGPLMIIPGTHKIGIEAFEKKDLDGDSLINSLNSNLKYTIDKQMIKEYADKNGIKTLSYGAGTAIFFHPNLFHASTGNLSPYTRDTVIITYNSLKNIPTVEAKRPEYICSRDFESLN